MSDLVNVDRLAIDGEQDAVDMPLATIEHFTQFNTKVSGLISEWKALGLFASVRIFA